MKEWQKLGNKARIKTILNVDEKQYLKTHNQIAEHDVMRGNF